MKPSTSTNRKKAVWGRAAILGAVFSFVFSAPTAAQKPAGYDKVDESVRQSLKAGESARVIMQYDTTVERDAAFNRLLDRGAAVATIDTEGGPALNVLSSAATLSTELGTATQVSVDARVSVFAVKKGGKPAARTVKAPVNKAPARSTKATRTKKPRRSHRFDTIAVAVVDSGLQTQEDLPAWRIREYVDFVSNEPKPTDGCGHGTHVAGTIAGNGRQSGGVIEGIDPDVDLVVLKVLGDDCSGNTSDVIKSLEWIAKNHARFNIRVVNLSLGHPVFESASIDPLVQAVERLSRKGIVVVTAAGNMGINPLTGKPGYGGVGVPCNAPSAVCVGALDTKQTTSLKDDRVADFSSRGPSRFDLLAKPDLVAEGVKVVSLTAKGSKLDGDNDDDDDDSADTRHYKGVNDVGQASYLLLSGTSMASPRVAGTAALMLTANPRLSSNTVKMALQYTARVLPKVDVLTQGAGALNPIGAVKMAQSINPRELPGENWLTAVLPVSNLDANGKKIVWGRNIVWGDRYMPSTNAAVHMARWDDNIVWGYDTLNDNIVWGNCDQECNIVWGNDWDENIVWGNDWDNIVWGNNIVWGDNVVWGYWADNIVWGFWADNVVWGDVNRSFYQEDNVVWGNSGDDNVVWGNSDNIVWGFDDGDNIVWGNNCAAKGGK